MLRKIYRELVRIRKELRAIRSNMELSKKELLQVHDEQKNRKLPYQHGLEVNGTMKANHITDGTIVFSNFRSS